MTRALPYEATPGPTTHRPRRTRRARRGLRRLRFHRIRLVRTGSDRTFEQFALVEDRVVAHQRHQVRRVHHAPASLRGEDLGDRSRTLRAAVDLERVERDPRPVNVFGVGDLPYRHEHAVGAPTSAARQAHWPTCATNSTAHECPGTPPAGAPARNPATFSHGHDGGPHAPSCWTSPILQNVRLMGPLRRHIMGNLCLQLGRNHFPDRRIHPRKLDHHAHAMSGH